MDRRVMIMCDVRASGITGEVDDSYLAGIERRPSGGVSVLWSDEPDQAMVFDDAAAAAEFCRDSLLEMFAVSFVPVSAPPSPAPAPSPAAARDRSGVQGPAGPDGGRGRQDVWRAARVPPGAAPRAAPRAAAAEAGRGAG